jgi:hypothetical protein
MAAIQNLAVLQQTINSANNGINPIENPLQ